MSSSQYSWILRAIPVTLIVAASVAHSGAALITIPTDYPTIQEGVDAANPGDTVYVLAGFYPEHVSITETITLQGENRETTIICGNGTGTCVHVSESGVTVSGFTLDNADHGFWAEGAPGFEISDCILTNHSGTSGKVSVSDLSIVKTVDAASTGLFISASSGCAIEGVRVSQTVGGHPLEVYDSSGTVVRDVELFDNAGETMFAVGSYTIEGLSVHDTPLGVVLNDCDDSVLTNSVFTSVEGDALKLISDSAGNTVEGNIFTSNGVGIHIGSPNVQGNQFYHNRMIENTVQVTDEAPTHPGAGAQIWDDGYPSGGNYWSDYTGVDLYHGPSQDIWGPDGIGDTPYVVAATGEDRYPLMEAPSTIEGTTWGKIKAMFM